MKSKLLPDTVYRVTKGNTDGSIEAGDIIYIDKNDGSLVNCKANGWLNKDELVPKVMDFEYEPADDYEVVRERWKTYIKRVDAYTK